MKGFLSSMPKWVIVLVAVALFSVFGLFLIKLIKGLSSFTTNLMGSISDGLGKVFESDEDKARNKTTEDALKQQAEESKSLRKMSDNEAQIVASALNSALLADWGEDEEMAIENIKKIKTSADWENVLAKFGTSKAHFYGRSYTLPEAIREYLHGSDLKAVQSHLKGIGVTI